MSLNNRPTPSAREALALATFLSIGQAAAQTAPASEPVQKDEKKKTDGEVLPDLVVEAGREPTYNPQNASSEKLTAPLLDTPQTITVIPKEVYTQQGAKTLTDVLKNTPGISFNAGENGFATGLANFSLRGVNTSGSIFIDGVRDSGNQMRDVFNLEQVEVVKGPSSDNGRGTAGGYVNLVSKTPQLEDFYTGSTSYSFDEYASSGNFRTSFDLNQNLKDAPLPGTAVRLNAFFQEGGVAGRDWAEANGWGVAPSLTIGLGTPTRFTLAYQHVEQNDIPDWGLPTGISSPGSARTGFISEGSRSRRDHFYGLKSDYDDSQSDSLTAIFEHDFANGMELTNQTRISQTSRQAEYTVPTGYLNGSNFETVTTQTQAYDRENISFSNITNLSYEFETGSLKHTLSTGLEISRETSEANRFGTTNGGNTSVSDPDPDRTGTSPTKTGDNDVTIDTVAIYAYDTVKLNDQWELNGGVRVERYRAEIERDGDTLDGYPETETTVGGKLGLVYKPVENGSIYTSAGVSAQPPGSYLSNPDISRDSGDLPNNIADAKVQHNINYEIGTKWNFFNNRLSTSAAVFYTERQDIPNTSADPRGFSYSDQIIRGIELGAAGEITENWSVFGGILLMDSERKNGSDIDNRPGGGTTPGTDGGAVDGDELAYTPNYTANLFTTYRFPVGLTIGGGLQYVGSSFVGRPDDADRVIENGHYGKLPSYLVFNALASYEINKSVTLRFNVDNVFDEVYAVSSSWNGARAVLGNPRTYTISADWKF
jgi:catecholate siderophore receptor